MEGRQIRSEETVHQGDPSPTPLEECLRERCRYRFARGYDLLDTDTQCQGHSTFG